MSTTLINEDGFIEPGLSSNFMRLSIETKNLLKNKGDIYIGGSETFRVIYGGEIITFRKTQRLSAGSNNKVLCKSGREDGIQWRFLNYHFFYSEDTYPMTVQKAQSAQNTEKANEASIVEYASSNISLKILKITKEKNVDITYFKDCETLEEYNNFVEEYQKLTQEEFDFLKMHINEDIDTILESISEILKELGF